MTRWLRFIASAVVIVSLYYGIDAALVTTSNGVLEGLTDVIHGVTINSYLGVPYAIPPLGDLRFR